MDDDTPREALLFDTWVGLWTVKLVFAKLVFTYMERQILSQNDNDYHK